MLSVLLFAAAAAVDPGIERYIPEGATSVVAMEWRKVLNSPHRDYVRREIPPASAVLLDGLNFIEGIERVVIAVSANSRLVILHGRFDVEGLLEAAKEDGGTVKPYKHVRLLAPPDATDKDTHMALASGSLILLGDIPSLLRAIDRPGAPARVPAGADLWVYSTADASAVRVTDLRLALRNGTGMELEAVVRAGEEIASYIEINAANQGFQTERSGGQVRLRRVLSASEFDETRSGWRAFLETGLNAKPRPQVIRIIGLDNGVKEIPLPPK